MEEDTTKKTALRFIPVLTIILSLFLLVHTVNALRDYNRGEIPNNVISVSGDGEVFAAPDIATFSFSVTQEGRDVKDAQTKVTDKINAAIKAIKDLGVEDKDIKTTEYNAYPKYEYSNSVCTQFSCPPSRQTLVGYEVSQTITVKVRKVDDAGKMLEAAAGAGVTNVSGLSFTIDDEDALTRQARQMAIDEAKEKAKQLAKDLGVRLVRIVNFSENGNYPIPMYYARDMANGMGRGLETKAEAPSLPTGENKIISNVTITYEIR